MYRNTCLLYNRVPEIYQKLNAFCSSKGFKVKESHEKFHYLKAKKTSILFWRSLRLELEIQTVGKEQVEIKCTLHKLGLRQLELENEYIKSIEHLF